MNKCKCKSEYKAIQKSNKYAQALNLKNTESVQSNCKIIVQSDSKL